MVLHNLFPLATHLHGAQENTSKCEILYVKI